MKTITIKNAAGSVTLTDCDRATIDRLAAAGALKGWVEVVSETRPLGEAAPKKASAMTCPVSLAAPDHGLCGEPGASSRRGLCVKHYAALPDEQKVKRPRKQVAAPAPSVQP